MVKIDVSVIIPCYNNEKSIINCLNSIIRQDFKKIEIIIIDDCSKDNSIKLINKIKDQRIKVFKNEKNLGSAYCRNKGIKMARSKFLFFIDADCMASKDWIREGLKNLRKQEIIGVEGSVVYVSENYIPTASDDFVENRKGGLYMAGCIAYKKDILKKIKGFDKKLMRMEDRDLAFKAKKFGKIIFNKKMIVYHQKTSARFVKRIKSYKEIARSRVILYKKYKDKEEIFGRIYRPLNFIAIFIPPIILGALLLHKYKTIEDFKTILYIYPCIFIERLFLWKTAYEERVFLL